MPALPPTPQPPMDERLIILIESFLDDSINEVQMCELRDAVESNPAFRAEFAQMLRLHGLINVSTDSDSKVEELVRVVDVAIGNSAAPGKFASRIMRNLAHVQAPVVAKPSGSNSRLVRGSRKNIRPASGQSTQAKSKPKPKSLGMVWAWAAFASCAAAVAMVMLLNKERVENVVAPSPAVDTAVAHLARADSSVYVDRGDKTLAASPGMALRMNDRLSIPTGMSATVSYANGGVLEFEGNAQIEWHESLVTLNGSPAKRSEMQIATAESGIVTVKYPAESTIVRVNSKSKATLFVESDGKNVVLASGSVAADVAPQVKGHPMIVVTPNATATILGTSFTLSASDSTRLEVTKGVVRLKRHVDKAIVDVKAGYFAVARAQEPMAAVSLKLPLHSPFAHWKFDEGDGSLIHDASGFGNDASMAGRPRWSIGKLGSGSITCIGQHGYVVLGKSPSLNFGPGAEFTFSGWAKTKADYGPLISLRNIPDTGADIDIMVGCDGGAFYGAGDDKPGALMALVRQDGTLRGYAQATGGQINDGNWHHFAMSRRRDGTIMLYLDGALQASARGEASAGAITTNLRSIGAELCWYQINRTTSDRTFLEGQIDDVRVYNVALSDAEIAELANMSE